VIPSFHLDSFAATDARSGRPVLRPALDALGVDTLLIVGAWTDACVLSTAARAVAAEVRRVRVDARRAWLRSALQ
jgi:nicotinamidase-related amidase